MTSVAEKKKIFLEKYTSPTGKTKYKRYIWSNLRYAWWKSLAAGLVIEKLPDNIKKIVSPFFWWGSVEIACAKELWIKVIWYDIFDLLVNYWNHQINEPEALAEKLSKFIPTAENYKVIKEVLKSHWKWDNIIEDSLDLAAIYYFNHNTSYWPHFLGHPSSVYLDPIKYPKMVEKVRNFRVPNLEVRLWRFEENLQKHNKDFLYCDPPYYLDGDSKMFVGMYPHRNFPIHHNGFRHDLLAEYLNKHKWWFVLSYNDCSQIREWYKDYEFTTPKWQYTFSQWDTRIWANRTRDNNWSHVKESHEILIYKPPILWQ